MLTALSVELRPGACPRPRRAVPRHGSRARLRCKDSGPLWWPGTIFAVDPTFVRLLWLVATICFPPLLLGYLGAWILVPKEAPRPASPIESGIPQPQSSV